MLETRTSQTPVFAPVDYKIHFKTPCKLDTELSDSRHQDWYAGTGIEPGKHPLDGTIWFSCCGSCKSNDVLVIAAQWCVSHHSGNEYWDYEITCNTCGRYTQRSFSEND
jgi:hypothetical protein